MAELKDYKNSDFSLTVNNRMHGIELRFAQKMSEEQLANVKEAGFRWSKRQQMWYAYQNEKSIAYAESLVNYYKNTMSVQEFNQKVEEELSKIEQDNINKSEPEIIPLEPLKILSVEQVENPIEEITVNELAELIRQRAELDRRIAEIKEVINSDGKKVDVSSEQAREFVLNMNGAQNVSESTFDNENQINKNQIEEKSSENNKPIELSIDDLETAKKFIPEMEYSTLLNNATQGEETEFFKKKIKHVADMGHILYENRDGKSYNSETKLHDKGFIHYFIGSSDWYVCEVNEDNVGFGYAILNGDIQNAEYGYIDLNEVTTLTLNGFIQTELDIYNDDSISMEHAIVEKYPELKEELLETEQKIENDNDYAVELADWIIQHCLESSVSQENLTISYDVILEYTNTPKEWLNNPKNIELVNEALAAHNDNELLDYNPLENEEGKFTLYFCSNADENNGKNTLFKKDDFGRWVRKSEEELLQENVQNEEVLIEAENSEMMSPDESIAWNEKEEVQQSLDTELDELIDKLGPYMGYTGNEGLFSQQEESLNVTLNESPFDRVTKHYREKYKDFYSTYEQIKEKHLENEIRYIGDARIRSSFEQVHDELVKLQIQEVNDIIKESENLEEAKQNAIRYFNFNGNDGLTTNNLYFSTKIGSYNQGMFSTSAERLHEYIKNKFNDTHSIESDGKLLSEQKDVSKTTEQSASKKDIKAIREQCREILKKSDKEITEADKVILAQYEGAGGLNEENRTSAGILNEFYTPNNLVEKVWQIVDAYAPDAKTVLEPSAGVGKFANNRPNNVFTMHELDETSARINKILHPEANVIHGAFQKQFFDEGERFKRIDFVQPKYDVVIGNPPYGVYNDKYKGLGEGKEFDRYEEYFISKGLDALKNENSIMAFVVPSGFLNTTSDKQKEIIAAKGRLIDAYRLPVGTFPTTEIGTDIIIMKPCTWDKSESVSKEEMAKVYADEMSNNDWFKQHPEKILGEVKQKTNRFGKVEDVVVVHEGLTVQDELNEIDSMLPKLEQIVSIETTTSLNQSTMAYIKKVTDSWDNNNWQVISPNSGEVDASNFFNQYFTDFVGSEMEKNPQLREEREAAIKNISNVAKEQKKDFYELVDETIKAYIVEKHGYKIWDYDEVKKHENQKKNIEKDEYIYSQKFISKFGDWEKAKGDVMTAEEFSRLYGKDFDEKEFPIWRATDWEGIIDRTKLNFEEENLLHTSQNYVEIEPGQFTHKVLFESGDITAKIESYKNKISFLNQNEDENKIALYQKNIQQLESVSLPKIPIDRIHFGVNSTLAEEFKIDHINSDGEIERLNLQESFILWAKGMTWEEASGSGRYWRGGIDYATANISEEDMPQNVSWYDIVEYIDRKSVKADRVSTWRKSDEEINADKAQKRKEAEEKRMARSETADRLFDKYLHEGLSPELSAKVEAEYNRRFNSYIIPDYSKLPLFIDGMSREKDGKKFKLYDQQIKGVSFLCNKGNGLLAYDVGVGKTAAGIVATVNQIQTGRCKRPVIVVPNAVYAKWYKDIQDLFPNIKVNDLYNLNKESSSKYRNAENPHKLDIPENSISLVTYEALKNITFTDESCENELLDDYSKLLSEDFDGSDRENAGAKEKIKGVIGVASQVKNTNYVFFEDCGFDNITVDEAHNFKNLWTVPRPKNKGESNEFSGIPTGKPSARALKLFAMTQLTQRHNDDRNVFLLTATPFTNSPLEVYSMLSYVGRKRLIESGIYSLRDFCTEFAHTKLELGVNAKGEIDQKQVMKDWKELPALQKILTEFIDKVDGEELKEIIRPKKFTHVQEIEMSDLQKKMMQIDTEKMTEVKEGNSAAVIVSMNAMRVGLVAPALADPARYPGLELPSMEKLVETSPKLKFVCDSVIDMYKNNPEKGQFIYMPLGQTAHGIVKDYLVAHELPKEAVEIINGSVNNTTDKKAKVTEKFNDPKNKCKILIGGKNTSEGIDLNGNSFVMYNCSLGWNPSETIQAEGRIWRQGNQQGYVHCVYPVMNDSIDSLLYQKHDEKRSRINEIWTYKAGDTLNVEDINPEELKFELIKDPQKRAKLILENGIDTPEYKFTGTKHIQNELNKVNSRIKSFEETDEKRKNLVENLKGAEIKIQNRLKNIEDYKSRELEVPEWCKMELKEERKYKESYEHQLETINRKFSSWGIKDDKDIEEFIPKMNAQKHSLEKELEEKKKELPKILAKENLKMQEKKILLPPVSEQRKILTEDIEKNLRPMAEVEPEIRTLRFEQMLSQKWEKGEISNEEKDLYSSVGYKRYYEWLDGEIENFDVPLQKQDVDVTSNQEVKVQTENEQNQSETTVEKETFENGGLFSDQALAELEQINKDLMPKVHTARGSLTLSETKLSDLAGEIKQRLETQNASKNHIDNHVSFTALRKQKVNEKVIER